MFIIGCTDRHIDEVFVTGTLESVKMTTTNAASDYKFVKNYDIYVPELP